MQEFLLAQDLTILCGLKQVEWKSAQLFYQRIEDSKSKQRKHDWREFTNSPAQALFKQRLTEKRGQTTLSRLLVSNRQTKCFDPRDKVYALLSLASDCYPNHTLAVDYAKDACALFSAMMKFCTVPPKDVFRYGLFLVQLLHIDVFSVRASSMLPTSPKLQRSKLAASQSSSTTPATRQTLLDAVGFQTGNIICKDSLQYLDQLDSSSANERPSLLSKRPPSTLPLPSRGVESISPQNLSRIWTCGGFEIPKEFAKPSIDSSLIVLTAPERVRQMMSLLAFHSSWCSLQATKSSNLWSVWHMVTSAGETVLYNFLDMKMLLQLLLCLK